MEISQPLLQLSVFRLRLLKSLSAALVLGVLEQTRSDILLHLFKKGSGFVVAIYCRGLQLSRILQYRKLLR